MHLRDDVTKLIGSNVITFSGINLGKVKDVDHNVLIIEKHKHLIGFGKIECRSIALSEISSVENGKIILKPTSEEYWQIPAFAF